MKKSGGTRFCYRTPVFPNRAFVGFVNIIKDDEPVSLYPFEFLYTSYEAFRTEAVGFRKHFAKQGLTVSDIAILVPVTLSRRFALKREFWQQTEYTKYYGTDQRIRLFTDFLTAPPLHTILVTPRGTEKGREYFSAAIPFLRSADDKTVTQFMFQSDYPVDQSAKFAAVYTAEEKIIVNWVKQKIITADPPKPQAGN